MKLERVPDASILVELDNVRRKGRDRALIAFRSLASEITMNEMSVKEVLIGVPDDARSMSDLLEESGFTSGSFASKVRLVDVGNSLYYEVKNQLARSASGAVIVMLDSDIIVQPGWLATILGHFRDPHVDVVTGRVVVGPLNSWYTRVVSAVWIFDPRPRKGVEEVDSFYANSFACLRSVFLPIGYVHSEGRYRGAGTTLRERFKNEGRKILRDNNVLALHPAPPLFKDAILWPILTGRDRALQWQDLGMRRFLGNSIRFVRREWLRSLDKSFRHRRASNQSPMAIPVNVIVATLMAVLRSVGLAFGRLRPSVFGNSL